MGCSLFVLSPKISSLPFPLSADFPSRPAALPLARVQRSSQQVITSTGLYGGTLLKVSFLGKAIENNQNKPLLLCFERVLREAAPQMGTELLDHLTGAPCPSEQGWGPIATPLGGVPIRWDHSLTCSSSPGWGGEERKGFSWSNKKC